MQQVARESGIVELRRQKRAEHDKAREERRQQLNRARWEEKKLTRETVLEDSDWEGMEDN